MRHRPTGPLWGRFEKWVKLAIRIGTWSVYQLGILGIPTITIGGRSPVRLGISPQTVKRRLKRGELRGEQHATPQGFAWLIEVPDHYGAVDTPNGIPTGTPSSSSDTLDDIPHGIPSSDSSMQGLVTALQAQVEAQQTQLETKDKQIEQLHILLQQAALPAPKESRHSWWRFWMR